MARKKKGSRKQGDRRRGTRGKPPKGHFPKGFSTPVVTLFDSQNPLAGITDAQCREIFGRVGREAAKSFPAGIRQLESQVQNHDPCELLATASFYFLLKGVGPGTDHTDEGPYTQAFVEVLQSICLRIPSARFRSDPVLYPSLFPLLDLAKTCSEDFAKQRYAAYETVAPEDRHALMTVESARLHTQAMRNWGYPQYMTSIVRGLLAPMEARIANAIGVGPLALLTFFETFRDAVCDRAVRLQRDLGKAFGHRSVKALVHAFCELTETGSGDEECIYEMVRTRERTLQEKRLFLVAYFHRFLPAVFSFTVDECLASLPPTVRARLTEILDQLSFQLGDLAHENPEHLLMQSKIRTKPLIRVSAGTYFVPIVGLLHSFFLDIVESLIRPYATLKNQYHKRRAVFLEEQMFDRLREAFPGCPVHRGTTGISPLDGKEFENDCLVVVGPLALVLEGKSERVDDVAKRGGGKTLRDHYETLVQAPALQAERFAKLLEQGSGKQTFKTRKHGTYELDLSAIRRAICISVTLDWLPALTLCWQHLRKSDFVGSHTRPALNLSLADLSVVLDVLASPSTRLHYFWRRIEWEEQVDYLADEEDLLVYYLSEGLTIPTEAREGKTPMYLYGNSQQLHHYYMAAWVDPKTKVRRPRRILTKWWASMLKRIDTIELPGKWDIACVLLDLSFGQQREFAERFSRVVRRVLNKGHDGGEDAVIFVGRPSESHGAVVGFAYRDLSQADRDDRAAGLIGQVKAENDGRRVVVIGRDVRRRRDLYGFLGFSESGVP